MLQKQLTASEITTFQMNKTITSQARFVPLKVALAIDKEMRKDNLDLLDKLEKFKKNFLEKAKRFPDDEWRMTELMGVAKGLAIAREYISETVEKWLAE
jgi:hypothetical protein